MGTTDMLAISALLLALLAVGEATYLICAMDHLADRTLAALQRLDRAIKERH